MFDHHVKFYCCLSYQVGVQKILIFVRMQLLETVVASSFCAEFGRSRSNGTSVPKEIRLTEWPHRVPTFEVNQGHRDRYEMIGYL